MIQFEILKKHRHSNARLGRLVTPHGEIETPIFMPVGTHGHGEGHHPGELDHAGAQIILGNTYHLYLAPGP